MRARNYSFKRVFRRSAPISLVLCALVACHHPAPAVLTVSAAASLTDAIQEIETAYRRDHPEVELRNNFGSSGTLAREIEDGAPVDVFISAASKPMDDLQARGLLLTGTRVNLLQNSLVLIVPAGSKLNSFQQLADRSVRSIGLGDPAIVPAGQYGQQALASMHLLDAVRLRLVFARDVRQVLAYVATGNVDAGIVYSTDAATTPSVRVAASAPASSHDPIVYPAAAIAHGRNEGVSREFIAYLSGTGARAIFVKHGFTIALE